MAMNKNSKSSSGGGKKVNIMPLGDRVLLRPLGADELGKTSPAGIIIPETVDKEKPEQGEVVAVGPGKRNDKGDYIPMAVKVGDRVVFSRYGYDEVKVDGNEYYMLSESSILGIIK